MRDAMRTKEQQAWQLMVQCLWQPTPPTHLFALYGVCLHTGKAQTHMLLPS